MCGGTKLKIRSDTAFGKLAKQTSSYVAYCFKAHASTVGRNAK